jgi:hypothetical protein
VALLITVFFLFRNNFVLSVKCRAIKAVYNYMVANKINTYKQDVYKIMLKEYDDVLFMNILDWSDYAGVKPQYIEDLKPYFEN